MNRPKPPVRIVSRRTALLGAAEALALLAAGCTRLPPAGSAPAEATAGGTAAPALPTPTTAPAAAAATPSSACLGGLAKVIPPTPIPYPGYTNVEPSTGLHVTAEPRVVDVTTYRLAVKGQVAHELSLTYDELRCLPRVSAAVDIVCPGYFMDHSNLAGASLASVLALAGPLEEATQVVFAGVDGRTSTLSLAVAQAADNFLAYEWEGEALPVSHGFPVRAALPHQSGGDWVKWVQEIEVS